MIRLTVLFLTLLLTGGTVALPSAAIEDPVINGVTAGHQIQPAMAARGDGQILVVWISENQDNGLPGIYARNLDEDGTPLGLDFQVNTFWAPHDRPRIAMNESGRFVVSSVNFWIESATGAGVSARIFDADGLSPGQEFLVNLAAPGFQGEPDVAMDESGNFLVCWQSDGGDAEGYGILARRFDLNGNPLSPEILVNLTQAGDQLHPTIAVEPSGSFVAAWSSSGQDGDRTGIYARRFDSDGSPRGGEFRVNFTTTGWQEWPRIAMSPEGDFVVTWHGFSDTGDGYNVFARAYDRTASLIGPEIQVNATSAGWQMFPDVDVDAEGNALVAWQGRLPGDTDYGIFARIFDSNGQALGDEFRVDDGMGGTHESPAVSMRSRQAYTIIWQSLTDPAAGWDIRGRSFRNQSSSPDSIRTRSTKHHEKKKYLRHSPGPAGDDRPGLGE